MEVANSDDRVVLFNFLVEDFHLMGTLRLRAPVRAAGDVEPENLKNHHASTILGLGFAKGPWTCILPRPMISAALH